MMNELHLFVLNKGEFKPSTTSKLENIFFGNISGKTVFKSFVLFIKFFGLSVKPYWQYCQNFIFHGSRGSFLLEVVAKKKEFVIFFAL